MVTLSVFYPKSTDSHFDHVYYLQKHMPLVRSRWQQLGLVSDTLMRGTSTLDGQQPPFELIGLLTFESAESIQSALAAHGDEILGDIPNFTNVTPIVQLNDPIQQIPPNDV